MGWFGGKSTHQKEVDAAGRVFGNLFEKTTNGGSNAPLVLRFERPDSRFRYLVFCLSTMQMACAHRMKNPDAILNDLLHRAVTVAISEDPQKFFGGPIEPQHAANQAAAYLQDYLHRWSAYVDITSGGNAAAATGIVAEMVRGTESAAPGTADDARRLFPLVIWIEKNLGAMAAAFSDLAR